LTPKNLQLVRLVLTDGVWSEVVSLPNLLMQQARLVRDHAPVKAAIAAQLATAVAILSFAPVRLGNLVKIELGQNLIKPGGVNTPYWLVFPNYDVKNRVDLNFKFDQPLTDLIDVYVHQFRPTLLRGANTLGCSRVRPVNLSINCSSANRSPCACRKRPDFASQFTNSGTPRQRFI
jgi:hypothetical protein